MSTFELVESSEPARIEDSPGRELAARYRNWRPSGRNCGNPCATSARASSSEVTEVGLPPAAETWHRMPIGRGQNRITPAGLQAPPLPTMRSAISRAGPPLMSTAFNLFGTKKPIDE